MVTSVSCVGPAKLSRAYLSRFASVTYGFGLSGFFFRLQGELLFVFDLFLFDLLVEVAPVAARNDELVDLELRMNALCPVKQISVERIGCGKPDAG